MFAVVLLLVALVVSYVIIQIGAVAFEITGLERKKALFQSLSCFSTTGFTTRESETIVGHEQRRKIAMVLMILGNIGVITIISSFVVSLADQGTVLSLRNLGIMGAGMLVLTFLLRVPQINMLLRRLIRKELEAVAHLDVISDVEVLSQTAGYGVARLHVPEDSSLRGLPLRDSGLRQQDIIALFIDRGGAAIPLPAADRTIHTGDSMICFGLLERIARYGSRRSAMSGASATE